MVWASALHAEGVSRRFEEDSSPAPAHSSIFFFCRGIRCVGVDLCCLSLIVTLWDGKLFLSYYIAQ